MARHLTILSILAILFYLFNSLYDLSGITISSINEPYYDYYANPVVKQIYIIALCLSFFAISILFYKILGKPSEGFSIFLKIILVVVICAQIFLIWYEMYYGSTFYYGEVRDKQGLPWFGTVNMGFLGSIFLLLLFLNIIFEWWIKKKPLIINGVLFVLIFGIHTFSYHSLKDDWKIGSS